MTKVFIIGGAGRSRSGWLVSCQRGGTRRSPFIAGPSRQKNWRNSE